MAPCAGLKSPKSGGMIRPYQEVQPVNRSLAVARPIRPPKEVQAFFDDLPLMGDERPQDYHAFFSAIAAAEVPSDAIDWLLLKDLVDLAWEIRRERRIKL